MQKKKRYPGQRGPAKIKSGLRRMCYSVSPLEIVACAQVAQIDRVSNSEVMRRALRDYCTRRLAELSQEHARLVAGQASRMTKLHCRTCKGLLTITPTVPAMFACPTCDAPAAEPAEEPDLTR